MKTKCILSLLLCFLIGCTQSKQSEQEFSETLELVGKRWYINENLGRAFTIHLVNNYLLIRNDIDDTKLTIVDIENKANIYNFGKRGDGPKELINPGPILSDFSNIDVFDGAKMSLLRYNLDEIKMKDSMTVETLFRTSINGIISLVGLQDSNYVASGVFPEGRLCLLDKKGESYAYLADYPVPNAQESVPFYVLGMAYQSLMCDQPHGKRVALATRYGEILQIYECNFSDKSVEEICTIDKFSPQLTTKDINGTPNFRPNENTKWGYLSIDATDKYIFALYSGRLQRPENAFYAGNQVHIFDWEGRPLYKLNLDYEGISLAVKGKQLFVLVENAEIGYDIVEYDFNN